MLLKRYGIVFREVLTRESILPRWREVLMALRRLEARGEVRGGRFVNGFLGEQFALPIAVDSIRAMRGPSRDRRNHRGLGSRSPESCWNHRAGRKGPGKFRPVGKLPRWRRSR